MTLDVSSASHSQDRKRGKISKIDLVNRRYSNPNDPSNPSANEAVTLEADSSALGHRPVTSKNAAGQEISKSLNKRMTSGNQLADNKKPGGT